MRTFLKKKKGFVAALLLISQLLGFFTLSFNVAYAAASWPGTPQGPSKDNNVCFVASDGSFFSLIHTYCYPDMGSCTADLGSAGNSKFTSCVDNWSNRGTMEKFTATVKGTVGDIGSALLGGVAGIIADALAYVSEWISEAASVFLASMAYVLDAAIDTTVNTHTYKDLSGVNIGWTVMRDVSNMFFIFVLLYIAIQLILGIAGGSAKRMVANLIIAAILINFSLFFTQVVIDAGNVLTIGFWNKIQSQQGGTTVNSASLKLMEGLRVQTIKSSTDVMDTSGNKVALTSVQRMLINLGGALIMFIGGYVFLAAGIMMVIRTVTLLIIMVVSPFAFLAFALPKQGGLASRWFSKLMGASFVAPAFVFMLYIVTTIATTSDIASLADASSSKFALAFVGKADNFAIIYNFIIIIVLLLATLKVAHAVGDGVGSSATGLAKKAIGYGTGAIATGGSMIGRQSFGRAGNALLKNEKLVEAQNNLVARAQMKDATAWDKAKGRLANMSLATQEKAKKGTWDIRNAPAGGLGVTAALGAAGVRTGKGSQRTYEKTGSFNPFGFKGTQKEKEVIETAKSRYGDDPAAMESYLKTEIGTKRYEESDDFKDLRNETKRKVAIQNDKDIVKGELKKAKEEGKEIGDAVAKQLKDIFAKYSGKEAMGMLKNPDLENPQIQALLNKQMLSYMATTPEKYQQDLVNKVSKTIMERGDEGARSYLIQQAKMQNPSFAIDLKDELKKRTEAYQNIEQMPANTEMERVKKADALEKHDSAIQDILGAMKPKDVSRLDANLKKDASVVRNLTEKHFNEIENYHKNIAQDADKQREMFAEIRKNALEKGTKSTKEYMKKAAKNSDSLYYDPTAPKEDKKGQERGTSNTEDDADDDTDDVNTPTT